MRRPAGGGAHISEPVRSFGLVARLLATAGVTIAVLAAGFVLALGAVRGSRAATAADARTEQVLSLSARLERLAVDLETGERGFVITHTDVFLQPYAAARAAIPTTERRLVGRVRGHPAERATVIQIVRQIDAYVRGWGAPVIATARRNPAAAAALERTGRGKHQMDAIRARFSTLNHTETGLAAATRTRAHRDADRMVLLAVLALVVVLALLVGGVAFALRLVVAPTRRLGRVVGRLEQALNRMAATLQSGEAELRRDGRELAEALEALEDEKRDIEGLQAFAERLSRQTGLEPVAEIALRALAEAAGAPAAALFVGLDDGDPALTLVARLGDESAPPASLPAVGPATTPRGSAIAGAPGGSELELRHGGRPVGVVWLALDGGRAPAGEGARRLERMADRCAVALAGALALRAASSQAALSRAVLDSAHEAFIATDEEGRIIEFNPSAEDLLGWSRDDVLGRQLADTVVPPASREAIEASLAHYREAGEAEILDRAIETEAAHRDGRLIPVEMTVTAVHVGERPRFNAFLRDITERRERELERELRLAVSSVLAESATPHEAIAGALPALGERLSWQHGGYWALDEAAQTLRCETYWRAPGFDADELERRSRGLVLKVGQGLPGKVARSGEARWVMQDEAPNERRFPRARAGWDAGVHAGVGVPVTADGRVIGVLEFLGREPRRPDRGLLDALGAVSAQLGQFMERRRLQDEADRLKDEFFALVSHELRTPLTSIVGYCEILLDEDDEDDGGLDPQQRRFLETVDRSAHRLLRLVGDLLFVAQIEAGTMHLELGDVNLAEVAADAVEAALPTADARGVSLVLHAELPAPIRGDHDRLGQATDNLVANALKFTPSGGEVSVVLTPGDGDATLEVSDTGIGIPADEQARLFDRFFRASTATDRAIPGIGLGLAIVKAIAAAHGGEISVSSVEGHGTTFALTVPLGGDTSGGERSAAPALTRAGGRR